MAFIVCGSARIPATGVGVTVYELDGETVAVARSTVPVVMLSAENYVAAVSVPDPERAVWIQFDGGGFYSLPEKGVLVPAAGETVTQDVLGSGRLVLENGEGTVGVTVYNADGTPKLPRNVGIVKELPSGTGLYLAAVQISDSLGPFWMQFDDGSNFSKPVLAIAGLTSESVDLLDVLNAIKSQTDKMQFDDDDNIFTHLAAGEIGDISTGGGTLIAHIADSSLYQGEYLEIIQGEEKIITFVVQASGRFDTATPVTITARFRDPEGNVVTKTDDSIERVTQQLDIQVFRVTLDPEDTDLLEEGVLRVELIFDNQKAVLTHALKIAEQLV